MKTLFDLPNTPASRDAFPSTTPYWITQAEQQLGAPLTLASGKTIPRKCKTCGAWTLTGYDAPLLATQATIDPYLATWQTEAAATLLGIHTYRLWGHWPKYELTPRHNPHTPPLETHPPAHPGVTNVVIAHTCKPPLASIHLPRSNHHTTHTNPPF